MLLEVLVPEGGMPPPGDAAMIPLNWKLRLTGHFGLLMSQQAKKGLTVLAGVTEPDHQGETGLMPPPHRR